MFKLCRTTGPIATIPTTPGLVVWTDGHIGISLDGVWAIEARGFKYGIVKTRIADRSWTKWGRLPASMLDYLTGMADPAEPEKPVGPDRPTVESQCPYVEPAQNLKKGAKGKGVKWVQWMLTACGYSVGDYGIDGDFGSATRSAVRSFQKNHSLSVDGVVGPKTREALKSALPKPDGGDGETADPDAGKEPGIDADDEPEPYVTKGKIADLSKWQGAIDWTAAARELDFCILRAQYGHEKADERYLEYAAGCEAQGIPYGAYSYCLFDDEETAREEARFFVERIKGTKPLYLVLDLEPGGVKAHNIRKEASAYIDELHTLGVKRVGLYIAHHAYKAYNIDASEADFVWIPRYGKNSGEPEKKPAYPCDLWQYTSNGRVSGIKGRVDLNQLMNESRMAWFRGEE